MVVSPFRLLVTLLGLALLPPLTGLACSRVHTAPAAGSVTLTIDLTPARDLLALFRRRTVTPGEIASVAATPRGERADCADLPLRRQVGDQAVGSAYRPRLLLF